MSSVHRLEVRHLYKTFPVAPGSAERFTVLEDINFTVEDREIVALLGPSGCGKTTLLRIIHGLLDYDSGEIRVSGRPVHGPGHDRGMVFQHAALLPWRTALQNVEFGLEIKRVPPAQRRETALRFLRLVGLEPAAHRHPHQLSGGMQQRVGLARALAIDPEILLMDEPFGALDAQTKERLQAELLSIHARTGKTILFVTHDLDEAVYLADRIVVMSAHPGRIQEILTVDLPRPRPEPVEAKGLSRFAELRTHIWRLLRSAA
jgi:NitT/TauT family transport system ATP-binding protein